MILVSGPLFSALRFVIRGPRLQIQCTRNACTEEIRGALNEVGQRVRRRALMRSL
jgi:hypothetical protein